MAAIPNSANSCSNSFQKIVDAFLSHAGLPFAGVLSAERIERVFAKHGNLFGTTAIYSTAVLASITCGIATSVAASGWASTTT